MDIKELYNYAYLKRPLNEVYSDAWMVPEEFLMEWLKDTHDYQRLHSDEELMQFSTLTQEQILTWLEEAATFVWAAKRQLLKTGKAFDL